MKPKVINILIQEIENRKSGHGHQINLRFLKKDQSWKKDIMIFLKNLVEKKFQDQIIGMGTV